MAAQFGAMKSGYAAMKHPARDEIVWAAALFEGEGSGNVQHSFNIAQKDRWILERLKVYFGGSIYRNGSCWRWVVSGPRGRGFVQTIFGFLSPRRKAQIRMWLSVPKQELRTEHWIRPCP